MKRRAVNRLMFMSAVMTAYFIFFFWRSYSYVLDLNKYFGILTENSDMIVAVNASRKQANADFVRMELTLGIIGAVIIFLEILCIAAVIGAYRDLAYRDSLTGVFSRTKLEEDFDRIEDKHHCRNITYFLFDMNYLKQINDGYGHKVGDDFLKAMAECIKRAFRGRGKVYRLAGDEFVALSMSSCDVENMNQRINDEVLNYNTRKNPIKVQLSFSKGSYSGVYDHTDPYFRDTLYTMADDAMYREKEEFHRVHPKSERIDRVTKEVIVRKL